VFAIDIKDPLAKTLNGKLASFYIINDIFTLHLIDIKDIETHLPDLIPHTINWFKNYKKADGKPENEFAFESEPQSKVNR
jgi:inorganic pyrophosphatase